MLDSPLGYEPCVWAQGFSDGIKIWLPSRASAGLILKRIAHGESSDTTTVMRLAAGIYRQHAEFMHIAGCCDPVLGTMAPVIALIRCDLANDNL